MLFTRLRERFAGQKSKFIPLIEESGMLRVLTDELRSEFPSLLRWTVLHDRNINADETTKRPIFSMIQTPLFKAGQSFDRHDRSEDIDPNLFLG